MQLVSKISNLCDPDPPTLQTDGWTTCNLNTALCTSASRGKNLEMSGNLIAVREMSGNLVKDRGKCNQDILDLLSNYFEQSADLKWKSEFLVH